MSSLSAEVAPFIPGSTFPGSYPHHHYSYLSNVNTSYGAGVPTGPGVQAGVAPGHGVPSGTHFTDHSVLQTNPPSSTYVASNVPQYVDYQCSPDGIQNQNATGRQHGYYQGAQANNQMPYGVPSQQYGSAQYQAGVYTDYQQVYQQNLHHHPTQVIQPSIQQTPHQVTYPDHYQPGAYYPHPSQQQNLSSVPPFQSPAAPVTYPQGQTQLPPSIPQPVAYQLPYAGGPGYQQALPLGATIPGPQPNTGLYLQHGYVKGQRKPYRSSRGNRHPRDFSNVGSESVNEQTSTERKKKKVPTATLR